MPVFDKGAIYGRTAPPRHLAFIVSAARRSAARTNQELAASAEASLRRYFPAMAGAAVTRSLVLREADATFASDPEAEAMRPGPVTPTSGARAPSQRWRVVMCSSPAGDHGRPGAARANDCT